MESKFRLSPVMGSLLSKRLEDRNRDKLKKKNAEALNEVENNKTIKIGPPARKSEVVKKVAFVEPEPESSRTAEKTKETITRGRGLPYVEVPPLKATLRTSKPDQVEDQSAKFGTAYKSRAPVELGLDMRKLIETVMDLEINIPLRNL